MDPVSAFALACNVAQILELSWKLVSKTKTIVAQGRTPEVRDAGTVTSDLAEVNAVLTTELEKPNTCTTFDSEDKALRELCEASSIVANELLQRLSRIDNVRGKFKSFRQALKTVYGKDQLDSLSSRLQEYRTQLNTRLLLSLRQRFDMLQIAVPKRFDDLDSTTQRIAKMLDSMSNDRGVEDREFSKSIGNQFDGIQRLLQVLVNKTDTSATATASSSSNTEAGLLEALFDAVRDHDADCVSMLADLSPKALSEVGTTGQTVLHYAARRGDRDMVVLLLKKGANAQVVDSSGMIPKDYCIDPSLLHWILENGPSIDVRNSDRFTALGYFAKEGDLRTVKHLLESGAELESDGRWGRTPLMEGCDAGNTNVVELLLLRGANVDHINRRKETSLLLAATKGYTRICILLIQYGASLSGPGDHAVAALTECCRRGFVDTAHMLIDHGAPLDEFAHDGQAPLHLTADQGHLTLVRELLTRGANVNIVNPRGGWTAIDCASWNGHETIVQELLKRGCKTNTHCEGDGLTPLIRATITGHCTIAMLLIDEGKADVNEPDYDNRTALYHAVRRRHTDIVSVLLMRGANTEIAGFEDAGRQKYTPLCQAAIDRRPTTIIDQLLQAGANVHATNNEGWTPLSEASAWGNAAAVRLLIQYGANANVRDHYRYAPLHRAAQKGNSSAIRILIEEGRAEVNATNRDQWTPLAEASFHGHLETAHVLLEHGADPSIRERNSYSPLNFAAQHGHLGLIRLLLDTGKADIDARNADGWSALAEASHYGNVRMVQALLERGADLGLHTNNHESPLDLASKNHHSQVVRLLQDFSL